MARIRVKKWRRRISKDELDTMRNVRGCGIDLHIGEVFEKAAQHR